MSDAHRIAPGTLPAAPEVAAETESTKKKRRVSWSLRRAVLESPSAFVCTPARR